MVAVRQAPGAADAPRPASPRPATPWFDRADLRVPLAWWAVARVVTVVAAAAVALEHHRLALTFKVFGLWDGAWYVDLARHGYPSSLPVARGYTTLAFFPLYSVLIRLLGGSLAAAIVVSWTAGAVATVLVHRLAVEILGDRRAAGRAAAAFSLFPGAFILSMAYAESLMVALAAACLLALVRRRWVLAGLCAAAATATRPNAVVLVLCCAVAAWQARDREAWRAVALAPLGAAAVVAMQWLSTGSPFAWFRAESVGWHQHTDFGAAAWQSFRQFLGGPFRDADTFVLGAGVVCAVVLLVALRRLALPPVLVTYVVGVLVLCYSSSTFNGRPRFLLTAFPLLFPLARLRGRLFAAALGVGAAGMVGLIWFLGTQGAFPP